MSIDLMFLEFCDDCVSSNTPGFAASAKPKQVRRDVPRVSAVQDVEEEEEEEEEDEQPMTAPVR